MDSRYMTKQRLGQITTEDGLELEVFATGQSSWYLFCPMQNLGNNGFASGTIQIPHHGRDLKPGWKKKLH